MLFVDFLRLFVKYIYLSLLGQSPFGINSDPPIFAGWLLMDLADDPDVSVPYPIKLKAVDGIASLKYYDFIPDTTDQLPSGVYDKYLTWLPDSSNSGGIFPLYRTFKDWIGIILNYYSGYAKTTYGSTTNAKYVIASNWYNANMNDTTACPLEKSRITASQFYKQEGDEGSLKYKAMTAYEALESICITWGLRCFSYNNTFYFIGINLWDETNTGTLASPINIKNYEYEISSPSYGLQATKESLDLKWGRYHIPVSLGQANQKLAGSQYGLLPAFKEVSVDFTNVSNISYFNGFPLLESPWYTGPSGSVIAQQYQNIGTFYMDGVTDKTFYHEIWLNFLNQCPLGGDIKFTLKWAVEAKKQGTTQWKLYRYGTTYPYTASWVNTGVLNMLFGNGEIILPQGASSHNLCDYAYLGQYPINFIQCKAQANGGIFSQGNWDFRYRTQTAWLSAPTQISGHGACTPDPAPIIYSTDPDSRNVTYTNSSISSGIGASIFAPVVNGAIGNSNAVTSLVQTGDDTDFLEIKGVKWGDTELSDDPSHIQVYDATAATWVESGFVGYWGLDTLLGTNSLAETLAYEVFKRQAKNVRKLNTKIAMDIDPNYWATDASGTRAEYITPFTKFYFPSHMPSVTHAGSYIMHTGEFLTAQDTWSLLLYEFKTFSISPTTTTTNTGGHDTGPTGTGYHNDIPSDVIAAQGKFANPYKTFAKALRRLQTNKTRPLAIVRTAQMIGDGETSQTITSLDVQLMPDAILKSGDVILLVTKGIDLALLKNNDNDYKAVNNIDLGTIEFEVSSDQSADDTSISVTSKSIGSNIEVGSQIHLSQKDLIKQYNNKTRGTIAGFAVDADGLTKDGIEIKGWTDSDTMEGTDLDTKLPTTESVKTYVDTQVASIPKGLVYQGTWNATTNTPTIESGTGTAGNYYVVNVQGTTTIDGISDWKVGDWIIFSSTSVWQKIDQSEGDTLQSVTTRGNTTDTFIELNDGTGDSPKLKFVSEDGGSNTTGSILMKSNGKMNFEIGGAARFKIEPDGDVDVTKDLNVSANINVDGSVDGVDIAARDADLTTAQNNISTNTSSISSNSSAITSNTTNITSNTTNITSNASDISTNTGNISTNTGNISSNASDISSNTSSIATNTAAIATKASSTAVATNTTNIATNATNISNNDTDIASNSTDIASNTSDISTNTTAIATKANQSDLNTTNSNVATNTTNISTNSTDISNNSTDITSNTSDISTNTGNISTNTTNIALKAPIASPEFTGTPQITGNSGSIGLKLHHSSTDDTWSWFQNSGGNFEIKYADSEEGTGDAVMTIQKSSGDVSFPAIDGTGANINGINIVTLNTKATTNETDIATNTTAIATKAPTASPTFTGTIAIPNISNLETAVSANTAKTGITATEQGKLSNISVDSAVDLNSMDSSITTNTSGITSNALNVTNLTGNVVTNASNISTNATNISNNDTDIGTNATSILSNTSSISTNTSSIAANTAHINGNITDIATNTTDIATNTTAIATKADTSALNTTNTNVTTNATDIATNTSAIATKAPTASPSLTGTIGIGDATISAPSSNFKIVSQDKIILDGANGEGETLNLQIKEAGTNILQLTKSATQVILKVMQGDDEFLIKGVDGTATITPFKIDMASGGDVTFSGNISISSGKTIDGVDISARDAVLTTAVADVAQNTTDLENNTDAITSNTTNIATNATNISSKQNSVTLTTEGTTGAATFNSGTGALNIPEYSGFAGLKFVQLGVTATQTISSGGNVGSKTSYTIVDFDTALGGVAVASPYAIGTGGKVEITANGTYIINYTLTTSVSSTANRTLAAGMLFKADDDTEEEYALTGTKVYNYDRGTETSSGGASWGSVFEGSGSSSYILVVDEIGTGSVTKMNIWVGMWIEGRASSASGITSVKDGCILSIMQIKPN